MLIRRLTCSRNLKKQCMYMEDIFLKTPHMIYFNFFPKFFAGVYGILLAKWPRSSPAIRWASFACFSLFFFFNCWLATFHREVKDCWYRASLEYKLMKLERGSQRNSLPQYFV